MEEELVFLREENIYLKEKATEFKKELKDYNEIKASVCPKELLNIRRNDVKRYFDLLIKFHTQT